MKYQQVYEYFKKHNLLSFLAIVEVDNFYYFTNGHMLLKITDVPQGVVGKSFHCGWKCPSSCENMNAQTCKYDAPCCDCYDGGLCEKKYCSKEPASCGKSIWEENPAYKNTAPESIKKLLNKPHGTELRFKETGIGINYSSDYETKIFVPTEGKGKIMINAGFLNVFESKDLKYYQNQEIEFSAVYIKNKANELLGMIMPLKA